MHGVTSSGSMRRPLPLLQEARESARQAGSYVGDKLHVSGPSLFLSAAPSFTLPTFLLPLLPCKPPMHASLD